MTPHILTLIPHRKGSKGLANKSHALLGGMSLVKRAEAVARQAGLSPWTWSDEDERPIVTDDEPFEAALQSGLAHFDAVQAASGGRPYDAVAFLTVNTPCREASWLREAVTMFCEKPVGTVFVAEPMGKQTWKRYPDPQSFVRLTPGVYGSRQTMPPTAYLEHTGVFCITDAAAIRQGRRMGWPVEPLIVDHPWVSLDIHTQADLDLANWLLQRGEIPDLMDEDARLAG